MAQLRSQLQEAEEENSRLQAQNEELTGRLQEAVNDMEAASERIGHLAAEKTKAEGKVRTRGCPGPRILSAAAPLCRCAGLSTNRSQPAGQPLLPLLP